MQVFSAPQADAAAGNSRHDALRMLMQSPMYQVCRVLRVTQTHWELPVARGKKAARLAARIARGGVPLLAAPRPGSFAMLAAG